VPAVPVAGAFLIAAAVAALVDWWAVARGRRAVESWAKPLTMALLVGVAATAGDPDGGVRACIVAGALLGLVGDVALLGDGMRAFMVGLGAFAFGHLAYAVAAVVVGFDPTWAVIGAAFMAVLLGFRFTTRTVPGARRRGGPVLAGAVAFYACVITAMVVTAWGTAAVLAGIGAMAFAASDWMLGHERFVGPLPGGRMSVIVPYHVGQGLLIVGLATA
jgi:uncharacterized membrane protein YhhN